MGLGWLAWPHAWTHAWGCGMREKLTRLDLHAWIGLHASHRMASTWGSALTAGALCV